MAKDKSVDREKMLRMKLLMTGLDVNKEYEIDDRWRPARGNDFRDVHSMAELHNYVANNKDAQVEGIFIEANQKRQYRYKRINGRDRFLEAWKGNAKVKRIREFDSFSNDTFGGDAGSNTGLVGDDFVPLMGGPFNKQPYIYDYLRAHAWCFHEYHHHPFARAIVHMTRDFVLGGGFRVDSDDKKALALWQAFAEVNNLEKMAEDMVMGAVRDGEVMVWWLPHMKVGIDYKTTNPLELAQKGLLPRIRLVDPSTVWDIITPPEDIERPIAYQQVFPTQYQIYTRSDADKASVAGAKFIMQQIAAQDMQHHKFNCTPGEKRGRSALYPSLSYLKRLRDCVNYQLIALQKQAAWCEDITVEGSQTDVDQLQQDIQNLGEFAPAGSSFIHTAKIKRQYLANAMGSGGGSSEIFDWCVNMIAVSQNIPVSYFGLVKSAGQSRASAIVGTEPVAKKFEQDQKGQARIYKALWRKFQDDYGVKGSECEITFPEIITQDRSAKIKDLKLAEDCGYISKKRAATMVAKEFDIDEYDFDEEQSTIAAEPPKEQPVLPNLTAPLTSPAANAGAQPGDKSGKPSAVTSSDRHDLTMGMGQ